MSFSIIKLWICIIKFSCFFLYNSATKRYWATFTCYCCIHYSWQSFVYKAFVTSRLDFWKSIYSCCYQKQQPRGVPRKRCSENMQQIYRRTQIVLRHGCSPVNLMHIFRTSFSKNTSGWLLLCYGRKQWGLYYVADPSLRCFKNSISLEKRNKNTSFWKINRSLT